jgi:hypothetical protein
MDIYPVAGNSVSYGSVGIVGDQQIRESSRVREFVAVVCCVLACLG